MEQILKLDFKKIREDRQHFNNIFIKKLIQTQNKSELLKHINKKELERILKDLSLTFRELLKKCTEDDIICTLICRSISKRSSRQGSLDEKIQIDLCNLFSKKFGVYLEKIKINTISPLKNGKIGKGECDIGLKSFDGKISGKINGWIFSKICFSHGGHQDNVFSEIRTFCDWVKRFWKNKDIMFLLLIETDLVEKLKILKNEYKCVENIFITNHYKFQKYIFKYFQVDKNIN